MKDQQQRRIWESPMAMKNEGANSPKDDSEKGNGSLSASGNHIWFYQRVDQSNAAALVEKLHDMSLTLRREFLQYDGIEPPPIHLHIHSYGGEVIAGWAMVDAIRKAGAHTHIEGGAASAATIMSIAGKHRTITSNSYILIHQVSSWFGGDTRQLDDHTDNIHRFMDQLAAFYVKYTKIPEDKIRELLGRDLWFSAKQALDYGMVDEILDF